MSNQAKIFIGTSGWKYKHWGKRFYPKDTKEDNLVYYSKYFSTVEINSSFYHVPSQETFKLWNKKTSKEFIFSIKLNRYITHVKRLILDVESKRILKMFIKNSLKLQRKLGVILVQLPPSSKLNFERLREFIKFIKSDLKISTIKFAIEFRNESWFVENVFKLLKENNVALVISSSPDFPSKKVFTSDFVYLRFHGAKKLFSSRYLDQELLQWSREIKKFPKYIRKVFIYFNNDYSAYAIDNALYLKKLMENTKS